MTRTYVGHREGGAAKVHVYSRNGVHELRAHSARQTRDFQWGGQPSKSLWLAESLLWDVLGHRPPHPLVAVFTADFLTRLPDEGFAVEADEILRWLGHSDAPAMDQEELVQHLGTIALRDDEEETQLLVELMSPCWDERSLRQ